MSIKREELANPNGCLNKAADDEPIFVLRANDPVAAAVVRYWASSYVSEKIEASTDGVLTNAQLAKAQEARGLANQMDAWQLRPRVMHYPLPPSGKREDGMFGRCRCGKLWPCPDVPK